MRKACCPPISRLSDDATVGHDRYRSCAHPTAACIWIKTNSSPPPAQSRQRNHCRRLFGWRCRMRGSSGCLVQTVWNVLTRRAVDYGINDYDVFYFDPDTSWAAEDAVIRTAAQRASPISASRSRRATRRASISGIPKSTACPTRRCVFDARHRPLPDQEHPDRHPPHARRLRGLCAGRLSTMSPT